MEVEKQFIDECKWLLANLENIDAPTEYFSDGVMKIKQTTKNIFSREILFTIWYFTLTKSYVHWLHNFKIDVEPWGGYSKEVCDRMDRINAQAEVLLAELGCTPENDWGRKANPPIV